MKILMLGWELPPHNSGGLGVACYELCRSLASNGAEIEFILPYQADHNIEFMKVTGAISQPPLHVGSSLNAYDSKYYKASFSGDDGGIFKQQLLYEAAIDKIIEHKSFDIIHAHDWLTLRAALRAKEISGCPVIMHVHSIENDRAGGNQGNQLVEEIEATCLSLADKVIAVSQHTKDQLVERYGLPAENISVVHNSINKSDFDNLSCDNTHVYLMALKKQGYKVISNIGRLTIQKNLTNLLYAFKLVITKAPKTILLLVGAGEQRDELIHLAADLGISRNVIFSGFLRGQQWRDSYKIADLFVMPSTSEPFGLTALEAVGYNIPTLISHQSGVSEVLINCLKINHWDVNDMADQILAVIGHDGLAEELRANALKELDSISWNNSSTKLIDVYKDCLRTKAIA